MEARIPIPRPGRHTRHARPPYARPSSRHPTARTTVAGGSIKSSWYGDTLPDRDFPALIGLHHQGLIDLNSFVTETISLNQVNTALAKLRNGEVPRSVILP
ncbi:hypothetical protein JMUB6875_16760 [Nocardia sp. JMUB6875]